MIEGECCLMLSNQFTYISGLINAKPAGGGVIYM